MAVLASKNPEVLNINANCKFGAGLVFIKNQKGQKQQSKRHALQGGGVTTADTLSLGANAELTFYNGDGRKNPETSVKRRDVSAQIACWMPP